MKKLLLSLSAAVTCMGMSAAVPVLKEQYKGSVNVTPETVTYSNPSTYDAQGNLIITGKFKDQFAFNGIEVIGNGVNNAFIAKYDATNAPKWAAALAGSATILAIDTDAEGNIYVGGTFAGNVDFLSATADGEPAISKEGLKIDGEYTSYQSASYIAKYDKDGKIVTVNSFVPSMLPFLAEKSTEPNIFGDGYLYSPSGQDLYFHIDQVKVDGSKVYASVEYTGQTLLSNGSFDGAYTNLLDMIYMDAPNLGVLSVDCATLETTEVVGKMELVGPFSDGTPDLANPVIGVKNGQMVAGFVVTASGNINDVKVSMGTYTTTFTPNANEVQYIVFNDASLSSLKKKATEAFVSYDSLKDLIINGNDVYMVGSFDTAAPAAEVAAATVAPVGKSDVFVAKFGAADLSVGQIYANGIDEGENGSEKVSSTALVDGALYINTIGSKVGGSYWFDGTAFSMAPATGCSIAVGNGVMALVSSDATKVDYQTYTYESKQTGITDIEAEFDPNAPVEYFNLQGIRVDNPENGLYIRRQGNKVEKILVK